MIEPVDRKWYALSENSDGEAELSIYDSIGDYGVGAKQFIADLKTLKGLHVHLRINSPGGSVTEGINIFNALRRHEGGLTVHIDALAASMASVVAMSGAPTYIADNALMMIHNPWTITMGDSHELRRTADVLDKMKAGLLRAYTTKTGLNSEEVQTLMDDETWLDATECIALGFADAIEDGVAAAASVTPADLRARFDTWRKAKMSTPAATEPAVETAPVDPITEPVVAPEVDPAPVAAPIDAPAAEPLAVLFEDAHVYPPVIAQLRSDLSAAQAAHQAALTQIAELRTDLSTACANLTRIETLCGVRGIDPTSAIPVIPTANSTPDPVAEYRAACEAKDWQRSNEIYAANKAAIWASRVG